jgi:nucleotide-binding universal stress UspA family protein
MFKNILVPIDVAHKSSWETAIPHAIELARPAKARIAIVTVVRDTAALLEGVRSRLQLQAMADAARGQLSSIVAKYAGGGLKMAEEVRFGSIGHEILATAADRKADLIVMASHRPEMIDYLIGPNAAHVAAHAACSVLVLRARKQPQAARKKRKAP